MEKIRAIVKRPDEKYGHVTHISNTLKNLQRIVEGPIETVPIIDGVVCICNEEGKLRRLERNFRLGSILYGDVIVGECAIVGVDGEDFCDCPLSFDSWKMLIDKWNGGTNGK